MSEGPTAAGAAHRVGAGTTRLVRAWKALPHESRLAVFASLALFLTLFLPWYQVTLIAPARTATLQSASAAITGWGAFSFVEAAVLLVAAGVLTLLFQRAEGRAFHLPGGDGGVITAAGLWTCLLIVWRIFDKQGATTKGPSATTSGIEWGIFVALAAAAFLAYAGTRIRAAHRPEPPLPGEDAPPAGSSAAAMAPAEAAKSSARSADRSAGGRADASPERRADRSDHRTPPPPRRRSGAPRPVPADRPARPDRNARTDRSAHPDRNAHASAPPSPPPSPPPEPPAPDRPRRRASAAEMFEHVVPDDPPTMPFGRAKPADVDATLRMASAHPPAPDEPAKPSSAPTPADEQLTMPLGNDDDTLPLDRG